MAANSGEAQGHATDPLEALRETKVLAAGDPVRDGLCLQAGVCAQRLLEQPRGVGIGDEHGRVVGAQAEDVAVARAPGRGQLRQAGPDRVQPRRSRWSGGRSGSGK